VSKTPAIRVPSNVLPATDAAIDLRAVAVDTLPTPTPKAGHIIRVNTTTGWPITIGLLLGVLDIDADMEDEGVGGIEGRVAVEDAVKEREGREVRLSMLVRVSMRVSEPKHETDTLGDMVKNSLVESAVG